MKKILFYISLITILCISDSNAQDVFGRAKNPDSTYLDANNFNVGEAIVVDMVNGQKVFVGTSEFVGGTTLDTTAKKEVIIAVWYDAGAEEYSSQIIYANVPILAGIATDSVGSFRIIFNRSILQDGRWDIPVATLPMAGELIFVCANRPAEAVNTVSVVSTLGDFTRIDPTEYNSSGNPIFLKLTAHE